MTTIKSKLFSSEQIEFIVEHYYGISTYELADLFNKQFNSNISRDQMKGFLSRNKLSNGLATSSRFKKGNVPFNKGKKMSKAQYERCKASMFKKGNVPSNRREIGDERIDRDGYIVVKIADGKRNRNWKPKHHIVWESVHGTMPPRSKIVFLDGNKRNFDITNLACVSNEIHAQMCKQRRYTTDTELSETNILITRLEHETNKRKKKKPKRVVETFPDEIKQFILDHYKELYINELTDAINERFNTNYTKRQIKNFRYRMQLKSGLPRGGKKGMKPWNTGLKYNDELKQRTTTFKTGKSAWNTAPIGTERFYDGCVQVKVTDVYCGDEYQKNWVAKARIVWEKEHGPIPDKYMIIHLDGDKHNCSIDNLACVSKAELIRMNKHHRHFKDGELTKAGVLISKIEQEIYEKGKK